MNLIETIDQYVKLSIKRDDLEKQIKSYPKNSQEIDKFKFDLQNTYLKLNTVHNNYFFTIKKIEPEILIKTRNTIKQKINNLKNQQTSLVHKIRLTQSYGDIAYKEKQFNEEMFYNEKNNEFQKTYDYIENQTKYYQSFVNDLNEKIPEDQKTGVNLRKY